MAGKKRWGAPSRNLQPKKQNPKKGEREKGHTTNAHISKMKMCEDEREAIGQMKNRKCSENKITIPLTQYRMKMKESKIHSNEVGKRNVCRMQSCRRHNDGNMIGARNNFFPSFSGRKQQSNPVAHTRCVCVPFSRNMHFICCCGITIKQSKLEIMLKMHLPFERIGATGASWHDQDKCDVHCFCVLHVKTNKKTRKRK